MEEARLAVSMIVGRDTDRLDAEGITRAAVETVAENASDGVIAPLLYLLAGGPVLGWMYKAINTMDSMVGYRNDRYLYFGRAAGRSGEPDSCPFVSPSHDFVFFYFGNEWERSVQNMAAGSVQSQKSQFGADRVCLRWSAGDSAGRGRLVFRDAL